MTAFAEAAKLVCKAIGTSGAYFEVCSIGGIVPSDLNAKNSF